MVRHVALLAEGVDRNSGSAECASDLRNVALLAEGVDRNGPIPDAHAFRHVALLAEGVDRNRSARRGFFAVSKVALLAEGVDRNMMSCRLYFFIVRSPSSRRAWIEIERHFSDRGLVHKSPSSRRAWIEIISASTVQSLSGVALLAEGVDRNWQNAAARCPVTTVALLAEGVDRNHCRPFASPRRIPSPSSRRAWIEIVQNELPFPGLCSRPPRGGRG